MSKLKRANFKQKALKKIYNIQKLIKIKKRSK